MDPSSPGLYGCPFCALVNVYDEVADHLLIAHAAEATNWALTNYGDELIESLDVQGDT